MWFDGANGGTGYYGGANENRTIDGKNYYEWKRTLDVVREIDSSTLFFSDAGPDIRWCGNENGYVGETNWNIITPDTLYAGKPGINDLLAHGSQNGQKWIPAEVDVSIRPGWFYHQSEDSLVKTSEELFQIYLTSVGRGSNLLLNVPPDRTGRLFHRDVESLEGFRKLLDERLGKDLARGANVQVSSFRGHSEKYSGTCLTDGNPETFWATDDDVLTAQATISLADAGTIRFIALQEYIPLGQRVKNFTVDAFTNGGWVTVASGTTIGYKRILPVSPVNTDKIRINITGSLACPVLSSVSLY